MIHPLWAAAGLVALVALFLGGHLLLLRDTSKLGLPEHKEGDPPLKPRWEDEPDDWPKKPGEDGK